MFKLKYIYVYIKIIFCRRALKMHGGGPAVVPGAPLKHININIFKMASNMEFPLLFLLMLTCKFIEIA